MSADLPHFSSHVLPAQVPVHAQSKSPPALFVQIPPFLQGLIAQAPVPAPADPPVLDPPAPAPDVPPELEPALPPVEAPDAPPEGLPPELEPPEGLPPELEPPVETPPLPPPEVPAGDPTPSSPLPHAVADAANMPKATIVRLMRTLPAASAYRRARPTSTTAHKSYKRGGPPVGRGFALGSEGLGAAELRIAELSTSTARPGLVRPLRPLRNHRVADAIE